MLQRIAKFFTEDIWQLSFGKKSPIRAFFLRWTRIIVAACQGFQRHECFLRAGLLTYYTLLALVPVMAVAFGIAKGFGFEHFFEEQLIKRFKGEEIIVNKVIEFAHKLLDRAQEGIIVAIGMLILFWTVLKLLGNIERAVNDIWEVKRQRSISRRLTDYLALIVFCPFFIVFSSTIALFVIAQIKEIGIHFHPFILSFRFIVPLVLNWILFSFLYIVMPNTNVQLRYGILAGVVAGTTYQLLQWAYITFQIGVSKYGAIYGSFAALPLFLVWVHLSWLIFLFGAVIGFHAEDESYARVAFLREKGKRVKASMLEIGLLLTAICIDAFNEGKPPPTLVSLSDKLQIPIRISGEIAEQLVEANVLAEVRLSSRDHAYHPSQDVNKLTLNYVSKSLNKSRQEMRYVAENEEFLKIRSALATYDLQVKETSANLPLLHLTGLS